MPTFSYTAPYLSPEDEKAELEALSEEERLRLESEVRGMGELPPETERMLREGLRMMEEAIELIPTENKQALLEATELIPDIVERESSRAAFLRADKYDAWAAAERLCEYWRVRQSVFGPERSFLPMTMEGAMREDVEVFRSGVWRILENDASGRPVYYFDRVAATSQLASRESIARCNHYLLHIVAESQVTQHHGCVAVVNLKGFDLAEHYDRILFKRFTTSLASLPMSIKAVHLCAGTGYTVLEIVLPYLKHLVDKDLRQRIVTHTGSDDVVLSGLQEYGIDVERMPVNGPRENEQFERWWAERAELERSYYATR